MLRLDALVTGYLLSQDGGNQRCGEAGNAASLQWASAVGLAKHILDLDWKRARAGAECLAS